MREDASIPEGWTTLKITLPGASFEVTGDADVCERERERFAEMVAALIRHNVEQWFKLAALAQQKPAGGVTH